MHLCSANTCPLLANVKHFFTNAFRNFERYNRYFKVRLGKLFEFSSVINGGGAKNVHNAIKVFMGSDVTKYYNGSLFSNDSLLSIYQVCLVLCV